MEKLLDLYSDCLLYSTKQASTTDISCLLDGSVSYDQETHFLSGQSMDSKHLWMRIKSLVRQYEKEDTGLIFDDTIVEKQYMDENELVSWHWDRSKGRNVKGINVLSSFCVSRMDSPEDSLRIPLSFETIKKTVVFCEMRIRKQKRQSPVTKNELMQEMISWHINNQLLFKYILADSWFVCVDNNMRFIVKKGKYFIFDIKDNRLAVTGESARNQSRWQNINQLEIPENTPVKVWLKDLEFPVFLIKQVFINKDQSQGVRFLVSNDFSLFRDQFTTLCKKRWRVEEYHKSIKQNASIGNSPARSVKVQCNHLFASVFAFVKLERIRLAKNLNHFAIKPKLYMAALRVAWPELNSFKENLGDT
jgi:hypothetical protein